MDLKTKKLIAREFLFLVVSSLFIGLVYIYCLLSNMHFNKQIKEVVIDINTLRVESGGLMKTYNEKQRKRKEFYTAFMRFFKHGEIFNIHKSSSRDMYDKFITNYGREQFEIRRKILSISDKLQQAKLKEKLWGDPFAQDFSSGKNEYHYYEEEFWKDFLQQYDNKMIVQAWHNKWIPEVIDFLNVLGYLSPEALQDFIKETIIDEGDMRRVSRFTSLSETIDHKEVQLNSYKTKIYSDTQLLVILNRSVIVVFGIFFVTRYFFYVLRWSINVIRT